jgi:colanic acid biosynthesis glycosyl transferase WcaI
MFPKFETIAPWALVEPKEPVAIDPWERQRLFGDAKLALLYSGSFGRAHSARILPRLARDLRPHGGRIAFRVRAQDETKLKRQMGNEAAEIAIAPFVPAEELESRLGAADVHIVSLRENWTGTVVPSKFFSALAIGRPVLFVGSADSAVAMWIAEFDIGWILNDRNFNAVVEKLVRLARGPEVMPRLFRHCHAVYRDNFSRAGALDRWDRALRGLIADAG